MLYSSWRCRYANQKTFEKMFHERPQAARHRINSSDFSYLEWGDGSNPCRICFPDSSLSITSSQKDWKNFFSIFKVISSTFILAHGMFESAFSNFPAFPSNCEQESRHCRVKSGKYSSSLQVWEPINNTQQRTSIIGCHVELFTAISAKLSAIGLWHYA